MKNLFLILFIILIMPIVCFSQGADRSVLIQGNVAILETGKLWSNIQQINYIFRPPFSYSIVNLYIRNNSGALSHNPTITLAETSDSFVSGYAGQTAKWNTDQSIGFGQCGNLPGLGTIAINSLSTGVCSFVLRNSAQVVLTFTSDGGDLGATYDIILNFSATGGNSLAVIGGTLPTQPNSIRPGTINTDGSLLIDATTHSNLNGNAVSVKGSGTGLTMNPCTTFNSGTLILTGSALNITTATTTQLGTTINQSTNRICGTTVTLFGTGTQTFQLITGTGANCGTGTSNLTGTYQTTSITGFLINTGEIMQTIPSGNSVCIVTTGTTVSVQGYISIAEASP